MAQNFTTNFIYDVFFSFRGEDTRYNFTGNLNKVCGTTGIKTFFDDQELKGGDKLSPSLFTAIEKSRMFVIVFSENYASSTWCLDELVKILQCVEQNCQRIWPIFYKVDPSDIRHQRNSYHNAMIKHEERFGKDSEKVLNWRFALTEVTNFVGYRLTGKESEYDCIDDIIMEISRLLPKDICRYTKNVRGVRKLLICPTFWRYVGFVSSAAGLLCFALSSSFQLLFGKWYLWKIFLYGAVCFIIAGFMLLAKKRRHSTGMWLKVLIVFAVFVITSLGSFLYEKVTSGKPDRLGLISVGLFALSSFSLSRQIDIGFEVGFTNFLLATFTVQIMQIHEYLLFIAAAIYFAIVVVRSYSESRVEEKVDQEFQNIL